MAERSADLDDYVDVEWFADRVLLSAKTISNWIADPAHPAPKGFKLGAGRCAPRRWRRRQIEEWLASLENA